MIEEATDADFAALLAGQGPRGLGLPVAPIETPQVLQMLRDLANSIRPRFSPASWMIVADGRIVGLCSLVRPPSGPSVDIGYGVAADCRGQGAATGAVAALLDWARSDARVDTVRAETSVHNRPSQRVLEHNGFQRVAERTDEEDGDLICWSVSVA